MLTSWHFRVACLLLALFQVKSLQHDSAVQTVAAAAAATTTKSRRPLDSGCTDSHLLHTWAKACFRTQQAPTGAEWDFFWTTSLTVQCFSRGLIYDVVVWFQNLRPSVVSALVSSHSFTHFIWQCGTRAKHTARREESVGSMVIVFFFIVYCIIRHLRGGVQEFV